MRTLIILIILPLMLSLPVRAADDKKGPKITYDEHILPIFKDKCLSCHNQDKKRADLILNNYAKVMEGGSSGAVVKPGDAENSPLYRLMAHKDEPFMPPKSPMLAKESLDLVQKWIDGGALENAGTKVVVINKPKVDFSLSSVTRGKPAGPPPMPTVPLQMDPVVKTVRGNAITALACNPWSPLTAVAGPRQIVLYNSDTLDLLGVLPFPEGQVHVLKFSRNGSLLLAAGGRGGHSGRAVVWSVTTAQRLFEVGEETDSVLAADISPDQTQIALGGPSKIVRIYSTRDGKLMHEIKKHTDWVTALEYSPDGVLLTSGDRNGGLFVWEAFTAREYFSLRGHTLGITEVSWRADGNVCASTSEDGSIRLWEMENGSQVKTWAAHPGGSQSVRYALDGRLVSAGRDRAVKTWDGNGTAQKTLGPVADVAMKAVFNHDGARVLAGDWTGLVSVWLMADGKAAGQISGTPPTLTERLDAVVKELTARKASHEKLVADATAAKAVVQKLTADLAAAQKVLTDGAAMMKTAQENVVKLTAQGTTMRAALPLAQAEASAKQVLSTALAEAAAKVKAAADKAPQDKALAAAVARANELAGAAANDLVQANKVTADQIAALPKAEADLKTAQHAVATLTAAAAAAPKTMETLTAQLKTAQATAATTDAAMTASAKEMETIKVLVEKLNAALAVPKPAGK